MPFIVPLSKSHLPQESVDIQPIWTDLDEAGGNYVVPNVLCPRDLVSRSDNMEKLYHTCETIIIIPFETDS